MQRDKVYKKHLHGSEMLRAKTQGEFNVNEFVQMYATPHAANFQKHFQANHAEP